MKPQRVVCAPGAAEQLADEVASRAARRIFLVTGCASYAASGAEAIASRALAGCEVERLSGFGENPELEAVVRGVERVRAFAPDLVVAVGGGSPMDMAKSVNALAAQEGGARAYVAGDRALSPCETPLVALPTTAGSGSQATHFAALWIGKTKHSLAHPSMKPDVALVDPELLAGLPRRVAAGAGLDALNQAIESYWSIHATRSSQEVSRRAIEEVFGQLVRFVTRPDDTSRLAMARGAHLAGEAIDRTKTTAPHAVSYPITSHFGVPHGHAVGLVLPAVWRFNACVRDEDCLHPLGVRHVQRTLLELAALLGAPDVDEAARRYEQLMEELGLTRDWRALGLASAEAVETIVAQGFDPGRVLNNPRRLTEPALRGLLAEQIAG